MSHSLSATVSSILIFSGAAFAGPMPDQHFDCLLTLNSGQLVTGQINEAGDPGSVVLGTRVFGAEMGEGLNPVGFAEEPGFQGLDFAPGTTVSFDTLSALGKWNGVGFDVADEYLAIGLDLSNPGLPSVNTGAGFVSGFTFATAGGLGQFHQHLQFELRGGALGVDTGVYLLELHVTSPSVGTTLPFWFVFNNGDSEETHDAAIAYVQDNLVPAPSALAIVGVCGLGLKRRRPGR